MPVPADGSVDFTARRLRRWLDLPAARTARISYQSEPARLQVLRQLAPLVHDAPLSRGLLPARQVSQMLALLLSPDIPPGAAVSFCGFDQAFPATALWADALQVLNVNRENFARAPCKQIWWIPEPRLGAFVRAAPDLDSWFDLKLTLTEVVAPPLPDYQWLRTSEPAALSVLPADARQFAGDLLARARSALAAGEDPSAVRRQLVEPALRVLRAAGLLSEVEDVQNEFPPPPAATASAPAGLWHIPAAVVSFTGRQVLLQSISERLDTASLAVLHGGGGIGKTQLALRFAELNRERYAAGWLVRAASSITLGSGFAVIAAALGLPQAEAQDQNEAIRAALDRLAQPDWDQPWLLILDDAATPEIAAPYLQHSARGHILVTSRDGAWKSLSDPIHVGPWSREESLQFLARRAPSAARDPAIRNIADYLGDFPIALDQAAAYMAASALTPAAYLHVLTSAEADSPLSAAPAPGISQAVSAAWNFSCRRLRLESPDSLALLEEFAYLDPDNIPLDLLVPGDAATLDALVNPLLRSSLASRNGNLLSIPRLVQAHIRNDLRSRPAGEPGPQARLAAAVNRVNEAFPFKQDQPASWSPSAALLPHALAVTGYAESAHVELAISSRLLNQAALYLRIHARSPEARTLLERALLLAEKALGQDHQDVAVRAGNLAAVVADLGDLPTARTYSERALRIDEQVYGSEHPEVATDASNLSRILRELGDLPAARALVERALRIDEQILGTDHPNVARDTNNLATILQDLGDLPAARALAERALLLHENAYTPDHIRVATSANNLGLILRDLGDLPAARAHLERALRILTNTFGPDHPKTRAAADNLRALDTP